ncbi:MAG: DUF3524 domain-containing protein, partial [Desulfobulbaceae bacterium]|nr:DUF3524 domain-containing protein [Desulfobulbaceae bacterium]
MTTRAPSWPACHRVIVVEPYFGGSHRSFLEGMRQHLPFSFTLLTLPARGWKWRMRLAAPYFADKLGELLARDVVAENCCLLCSTFVDVATLKGLLPAHLQNLPILTYFHENQFAYPM